MALLDLDTPTMEALTLHWCTTARHVIARPMLANLVEPLEALGAQFIRLRQIRDRLTALEYELTTADNTHDADLGRCWAYMTGIIRMYTEEARGVPLLVARDTLMATGTAIKDLSFLDQGLAAERARADFTAALRTQLAALSLPGADLVATMDRWIDAGIALKQLDAERKALLAAQRALDEDALRRDWIKAVQQMRTVSRFDEGLDQDAQALLFARLSEAEYQASQAV